jgi:short-subunit dehydrogenase
MTLAGRPVNVTAVYPGGTDTAFIRNMTAAEELGDIDLVRTYSRRLWTTSPQKAAQVILNGVRKNRARVLIGPDTKLLELFVRLSGSSYQRLFPAVQRRFVPLPR